MMIDVIMVLYDNYKIYKSSFFIFICISMYIGYFSSALYIRQLLVVTLYPTISSRTLEVSYDDDDDEYIFVDDYINYSMIMIIINFHTSYII